MSDKIVVKKLTKKQKSKFQYYLDKWVKIGLNTEKCNVEESIKAIKEAYKIVNIDPPKFFIGPVDSPYQGALAEKILHEFSEKKIDFEDEKHLNELVLKEVEKRKEKLESVNLWNQVFGCSEFWISYIDFFQTETPEVKGLEIVNPLKELAKHIGMWTPLKDVAILQNRPKSIHRDSQNRLHNLNGYAIEYDGCKFSSLYRIHGVAVTKKIIDKDFNVKDIEKENNVEVRRVMIDIYGQERFLLESNAVKLHEDDYGTLYIKKLNDDEPLMMVKVINSTPEPDGTFKDYFLRVDPNAYGGLKTARAAVASTWRHKDGSLVFENPEDYDCLVET
jgi:hypothetical protein